MAFKKSETGGTARDSKGKVVIKIILQDNSMQPGYPKAGNLKQEIVVDDTTVGEVYAAINMALFNDGVTE
jgi:hypothetical protein